MALLDSLFRPKAKPDQPVEFWLMLSRNLSLGVLDEELDYSWIGRVQISKGSAAQLGLEGMRMPKGCGQDNPWVIVKVGLDNKAPILQFTKSEFLEKFGDVPLSPDIDSFMRSYQRYTDSASDHLRSINATLGNIIQTIKDMQTPQLAGFFTVP